MRRDPSPSARSRASSSPRMSSSDATISDTTRPAPNRRAIRRNTTSVTPDGAQDGSAFDRHRPDREAIASFLITRHSAQELAKSAAECKRAAAAQVGSRRRDSEGPARWTGLSGSPISKAQTRSLEEPARDTPDVRRCHHRRRRTRFESRRGRLEPYRSSWDRRSSPVRSAFLAHPAVDVVRSVIHPDDRDLSDRVSAGCRGRACSSASRAARTRRISVLIGLEALVPRSPEIVLVHDAARPFATADLIGAVAAGRPGGAAVPGCAVTDTMKLVDERNAVVATRTGPRAGPSRPAGVPFDASSTPIGAPPARARWFHGRRRSRRVGGASGQVFEGDPDNCKLTLPTDFAAAERRSPRKIASCDPARDRLDVHAFTEGDHVWLGGLRVPHSRGVRAHSDGDVILHALTDAISLSRRATSASTFRRAIRDGGRLLGSFPRRSQPTRCVARRVHRPPGRNPALRDRRAWPPSRGHAGAIAKCQGSASTRSRSRPRPRRVGLTGRGEGLAAQAAATIRLPVVSDDA